MFDEAKPSAQVTAQQIGEAVADLFEIHDVTLGAPRRPDTIRLRGKLRVPSDRAYPQIAARLRELGYTAFLRRDPQLRLDTLEVVPGIQPLETRSRAWVSAILYGLTILTTLYAGASWSDQVPAGADLRWILTHLWVGWPFALSLMVILTGHELGHYFTGRYYKVPVSLPYFIPMPVSLLGTMGAFIVMKGRSVNRRQMLAVGATGPLVGFALAVPILILGLSLSTVEPMQAPPAGTMVFLEGNSLLYLLLKLAMFGQILPGSGAPPTLLAALGETGRALLGIYPIDQGFDVFIHPVALAGWAGLLVTALNLMPVGQLDGGHVLYSLVGQRARRLAWPLIGLLVLLGFLFWEGWLLLAALVFLFGQSHPDPLDDVTRLDTPRKLIAVAVLLVLVLTFTVLPMRLVTGEIPPSQPGQSASLLLVPTLVAGATAWRNRPSRRR